MDFFRIRETIEASKNLEKKIVVWPDFVVKKSKDLMVRGKAFYAIWDEKNGLWSTDEYDVQRLVDEELRAYAKELKTRTDSPISIKYLSDFSSNVWIKFRNYVRNISDSYHQLDSKISFLNSEQKKEDYISRRLPYPLQSGEIPAYEELISTLYAPEERQKLEWAIGSIIAGDSVKIQKFIVLFGDIGTGKGTVLDIIKKLFVGYYATFDAKALASTSSSFSTEVFKDDPLVAIQSDGDLSKIEDNEKLNTIVSHEEIVVNEKFKSTYSAVINAFLFMGTNKPVRITDSKSGLIRRLIDVNPSGQKIAFKKYGSLVNQINFELGGIAAHCLKVYESLGMGYYEGYKPLDMVQRTNPFYNFVEDTFLVLDQEYISLQQAYELYKAYCADTNIEYKMPRHRFRDELKNYFESFDEVKRVDGRQIRSVYTGFIRDKFKTKFESKTNNKLKLNQTVSLFDTLCADRPAQLASSRETPRKKWDDVETRLEDIDTKELHYVRPGEEHIVIDFDIKDSDGNKSAKLNLEAAAQWPSTYAELSKSGEGIHLHYIYDGDVSRLSRVFDEGIEVKVFEGNASLRRKLTKCNDEPVAHISSGLPLKAPTMIDKKIIESEQSLRNMIHRNLQKEIHPGTKPSIDFIHKLLEDAYSSGMTYDVRDLRPSVLSFALHSSNQSQYCLKLVKTMRFVSEQEKETNAEADGPLVFFDIEVFPNLVVVVWKNHQDNQCVRMINPTAKDIEPLFNMRLVGYYCRRYDNHILYAIYLGYSTEQLYDLSQKIINGSRNSTFAEAYNVSYADVYDFASEKKSLKQWEIELGIHHLELGLPWDQPVPDDLIDKVAEYCENDVIATEKVFEARSADFTARKILSAISGLSINDTTQKHTARILFGSEKEPQKSFKYTDLSELFPGYEYSFGKSTYKGIVVGEGGLVDATPGMWENVALLDIASMHPTSAVVMDYFGPYTDRFHDLLRARLAIKRGDFEKASQMFDGKLRPYLQDESNAKALSFALKIAVNIVYGLTSAKFDNPFRDKRNVDNIVAKRGALFMVDLKEAVEAQGFKIVHIKTDSVKIPDATPEIIQFVTEFGRKYGYTFEHEATYDKMCLVNDAVYVACEGEKWTTVGAQFQHPYVKKALFTHDPLTFEDRCEGKSVQTALYLDMDEDLPEGQHNYRFVGKTGLFCPVLEGTGGGVLLRKKEDKYYAATGTKGFRWREAEQIKLLGIESSIDESYFTKLVDAAVDNLSKYGDVEWFLNG